MSNFQIKISGAKLENWLDELNDEITEYFDSVSPFIDNQSVSDEEIENILIRKKIDALKGELLAPDTLELLARVFTLYFNLRAFEACYDLLKSFQNDIKSQYIPCDILTLFLECLDDAYCLHIQLFTSDSDAIEESAIDLLNKVFRLQESVQFRGEASEQSIVFVMDNIDELNVIIEQIKNLLITNQQSSVCDEYVFYLNQLRFKKVIQNIDNTSATKDKKLVTIIRNYLTLYHKKIGRLLSDNDTKMISVYLDKIDFFIQTLAHKHQFNLTALKIDVTLSLCSFLDIEPLKDLSSSEENWMIKKLNMHPAGVLRGNLPTLSLLYEHWFIKGESLDELLKTSILINENILNLKLKRIELFILYEKGRYSELVALARQNFQELEDDSDALCLDLILKSYTADLVSNHNINDTIKIKSAFVSALIASLRYLTNTNKYEFVWTKYLGKYKDYISELDYLILRMFNLLHANVSFWQNRIMVYPRDLNFDELLAQAKEIDCANPWVIEAELSYYVRKRDDTKVLGLLEKNHINNIDAPPECFLSYFSLEIFRKIKSKEYRYDNDIFSITIPRELKAVSLYVDEIIDILKYFAKEHKKRAK